MDHDTGQDLVRRARDGSEEAFRELLELCRPQLESALRRQIGAELQRFVSLSDVEQEVLVRVRDLLARLGEDATIEDFAALLLHNARWVVGKLARQGARFTGESAAGAGTFDEPAPDPAAASAGPVTRNDEKAWLDSRIGELDPTLAIVVRLRMRGLTFEQIGTEISIGTDAARKRFAQAAEQLARAAGRQ